MPGEQHATHRSGMDSDRAPAFGKALSERAFAAGLAVTAPDGTRRPIPIGAIPVIVDDAEIARRGELATHLVRATAKAARWRLAGPDRDAVLAELGPAERRLVLATDAGADDLAVARVDFLGAPDLAALEVNATIPAMQGYSDIAAEAWLATVAPARLDVRSLVAANGSNTAALLAALTTLHARQRRDELGSIGLLCRRGDAQRTELDYLRAQFVAAGLQADIVHPDELGRERGFLRFRGRPLQLLYRHLFLSRLDATPAPEIEAALADAGDRGTLVLNRPAPHLEMKSTLAVLSRAVSEPRLAESIGLTDAESEAIGQSVPWTRVLATGAGGIDAASFADVRDRPDAYVLKRSWSYGGHDVFVGRARDTDVFRNHVAARFPGVHTWAELVEHAARDAVNGRFVVQRAVPRSTSLQWLCTPDAVRRAEVVTDYAAYASIGATPEWSGVCRAATSDVVNIVGGGAVVPLIRRSVAEAVGW